MKIELVKKITDLITTYGETATTLNDDVKASIDKWKAIAVQNKIDPLKLKNSVFEEINDARTNADNIGVLLNQKLKLIVADTKQKLFPETVSTINRSADYTARAGLALQFLSYQFDNLTDETAYLTLKEFTSDYDQMRLFKSVIERHMDMIDENGNQRFPKTFGKLINAEVLLNTINEIEQIAESLFVHPKMDGEHYIFGGMNISLYMETFEELDDEAAILKLASDVDVMAADLVGV